jgi:hypothetical protein
MFKSISNHRNKTNTEEGNLNHYSSWTKETTLTIPMMMKSIKINLNVDKHKKINRISKMTVLQPIIGLPSGPLRRMKANTSRIRSKWPSQVQNLISHKRSNKPECKVSQKQRKKLQECKILIVIQLKLKKRVR